jgi:hypothetical protein
MPLKCYLNIIIVFTTNNKLFIIVQVVVDIGVLVLAGADLGFFVR